MLRMQPSKSFFEKVFRQTKVLRPPKHLLATFGNTTIQYYILSEIVGQEKQCRLREGQVTAERPQILTPDVLRERFEGFGAEAPQYTDWLFEKYGEALRALEYRFKNAPGQTHLQQATLEELADRLNAQLDTSGTPRSAILAGPDATWSLSVMKFIVDVTLKSFQINVQELEERGFFPNRRREAVQRHQEIQTLFEQAAHDQGVLQLLGNKLQDYRLFQEYEDRFLELVKKFTRH